MSNARPVGRAGTGSLHHLLFTWVTEAASWPDQAWAGSSLVIKAEDPMPPCSHTSMAGSNSPSSHVMRMDVGMTRFD